MMMMMRRRRRNPWYGGQAEACFQATPASEGQAGSQEPGDDYIRSYQVYEDDQVYHDHAGAGDDKHTNIGWTKLVKD